MNPRPRRGDTWTCPTCNAVNEPFRSTCINFGNHPAPKPEKGGKKK